MAAVARGRPTTVATGGPKPGRARIAQARDYRVASGDTLGRFAQRFRRGLKQRAEDSAGARKALELADAPVFALTQQLISGHSAKHLVAALAAWPVVRALQSLARGAPAGHAARTIR